MDFELERVKLEDKDKLFRLLQYALYDGSQYIDNDINDECVFEYGWFDNYFTDEDRDAFFIKSDGKYLGMVMVNENLKFNESGKCISEFFVLPRYRRNHIGKRVASTVFDMYVGDWEVQPMEYNPIAYSFWKSTVSDYTNGDYSIKNDGVEDVFMFKSRKI